MKRSAISGPLYVSFLCFSLIVLFFGKTGVSSLEQLNRQRDALMMNLTELEMNRDRLGARLESLRRDPQAVVVEARSLGLFPVGEHVLVFENNQTKRTWPEAGIVLNPDEIDFIDENLFRIIALSAGILVLVVSLVYWKLSGVDSP